MGCQEGGYLEDVEGSWPETWRTGSSLMSWMTFFEPNEDTLKISCWYLYWKCVRKGESRRGVLGGRCGFLTGSMDIRVISDVMNDVLLPKGRYPENFVWISQLEVCQEGGSRWGVLRRCWGFRTGDMDDRVIPEVMNHVFLPRGRYPENFVLISQSEVRQEGVSRRGVLGGCWGFLTRDMDDRVIPNIMNDVLLPWGSYPENFRSISLSAVKL